MNLRKNIMFVLFAFLCVIFAFNFKVYASSPNISRTGGKDRYDTSVKISEANFTSSNYVVIASGENFPDALCAAPLAKKYNAPILITEQNGLRDDAISEIKRLGAKNALIVGGEGAVSSNVESELKNIGIMGTSISRFSGQTRYDTSIEVAKNIGTSNGYFLASGQNFPDALSAASIAASKQMPIILTEKDYMEASVKQFVDNNKSKTSYIIGGEGAVSDTIANYTGNSKRLSGSNRYETNSAVINEFLKSGFISMNTVYVAGGNGFADALSSSSAAAKTNSPIVLVDNNNMSQQSIVKNNISSVSSVKIIGGTGVVTDAVVNSLLNGSTVKSKTVTLDAGHGGYDSGAVGPTGVLEKNVNLAVTLKIGEILKQNGINVVYTRTSDNVSWPADVNEDLQKRCEISDAAGSDYFVAIHMNSADAEAASGTETYYYSSSTDGKELASDIQSSLVNAIDLTDRGIKTANYYVIKYTAAPAVLVEVGFISNPEEEKLLNSDSFQNKAAQGIANGILEKINQDK